MGGLRFLFSHVPESGHGAPRIVRIERDEKQKQILRTAYPTAWEPQACSVQDDTVSAGGVNWATG